MFRRILALTLTPAVLTLAAAAPAEAASLYDSYFGKTGGGSACYERTYPTSHFRRHPRQTVKRIWVVQTPVRPGGETSSAKSFEVVLAIRPVDASSAYTSNAYCRQIANRFNCSVEADGGQFRLTPGKGGLVLTTGGISIEGAKGFLSVGERGGDDRTFRLARAASSACN